MKVNAKVESNNNPLNAVKWLIVVALIAVGVVGNSYYSDLGLLYRVSALLALGALTLWIAVATTQGAALWHTVKESQTEIRKVVWPTRNQLTTYTAVVLVFVTFIIAVVSLIDLVLGRLVFWVFG